jgi:hypothetical protein
VLLAGGISAAVAGRRAAVAASLTALSIVVWAAAPVTGASENPQLVAIAGSAVRYLLPAIAAGAAALALACGARAPWRWLAGAALVAALIWNVGRDAAIGFPVTPSAGVLAAGMAAGAAVAWFAGWLVVRVPPAVTTLIVALLLAFAGPGWLGRHAHASRSFDPAVSRWFDALPGFDAGTQPIAMAPNLIGPLAGDRLTHPLRLIRGDEPCARVRAWAREGWVVVQAARSTTIEGAPPVVFPVPVTARACLAPARPVYAHDDIEVYALRPRASG